MIAYLISPLGGGGPRTMTRVAAPPTLLQLQTAESTSTQLTALRSLKNELIGHDQRKEVYVVGGVIPALAQVLTSRRPAKATSTETNKTALNYTGSFKSSEESEAGLQAILIVGSLAQGMCTFEDTSSTI